MANKIIDGKLCAANLLEKIRSELELISIERKPALAVILVGDNPASHLYVRNKKNACSKVGIKSLEYILKASTTQDELLNLINKLNDDRTVDGILVQLPLPTHLDSKIIIDKISPNKDVDGFHRYNMGSLALNSPRLSPCTPHGVMYLLQDLGIEIVGKHAVIIGSSNIVGRPMALELLNYGATVTVCNSKTQNLRELTKLADILVVAIGKPKFIKDDWLKDGVIICDVGINRLADNSICGDVDYEAAYAKASFITPVPGGVGPMTIAILLKNTVSCYYANHSLKSEFTFV